MSRLIAHCPTYLKRERDEGINSRRILLPSRPGNGQITIGRIELSRIGLPVQNREPMDFIGIWNFVFGE